MSKIWTMIWNSRFAIPLQVRAIVCVYISSQGPWFTERHPLKLLQALPNLHQNVDPYALVETEDGLCHLTDLLMLLANCESLAECTKLHH